MNVVSNYQYVTGDLLEQNVEAIVIPANFKPKAYGGLDKLVYKMAGEKEMLEARRKIGVIEVGECGITPGFRLNKKVIHTVTPSFVISHSKERLRMCYDNALKLACDKGIRTIAFPLLGSGNMGFPYEIAITIAENALDSRLANENFDKVYLVEKKTDNKKKVYSSADIAKQACELDYSDYSYEELAEMNVVADFEIKDQAEHIHKLFKEMQKDISQWEEFCKKIDTVKRQMKLEEMANSEDDAYGCALKDFVAGYKGKRFVSYNELELDLGISNLEQMLRGKRAMTRENAIKLGLYLKLEPLDFQELLQLATKKVFPQSAEDKAIMLCLLRGKYDVDFLKETTQAVKQIRESEYTNR